MDDGLDVFRYLDDDTSGYTNPSPSNQNLVVRNNLVISRMWHRRHAGQPTDPSVTIPYSFHQGLPGSMDAANTGVVFDYNLLWNTASASGVMACTSGLGGGTTYTRTRPGDVPGRLGPERPRRMGERPDELLRGPRQP